MHPEKPDAVNAGHALGKILVLLFDDVPNSQQEMEFGFQALRSIRAFKNLDLDPESRNLLIGYAVLGVTQGVRDADPGVDYVANTGNLLEEILSNKDPFRNAALLTDPVGMPPDPKKKGE